MPGEERFLEINAQLSRLWPNINTRKEPPEDADEWADVKDKLSYLEEA